MRGLIKNSNYDIEYFVYGTGNKILLAFHGFNNHAEDFKIFGNTFGNEFTIVAINDLGDTKINAHLTQYDTTHGRFRKHLCSIPRAHAMSRRRVRESYRPCFHLL